MDVLDVDLEKARKEQIAKNEARLQEHLGINVLPSATQHNASSSNTNTNSKGVKRGATKALSSAPKKAKTPTSTATQKQDQVRRSLRKQGQAPDAATAAGIRDEKGKGNIVLEDASALDHANAGSDSTASLKPSRPVGQLSLVPENREDVMDDTFMQDLHEQCELIPPKSTSINVASTATFARASLAEGDVCKVVPKGIVHMDFLPTLSQIVCAAGDKGGSIGIWKPGVNDAADGLYLQTVHGQYISGLRWSIHRASPSLITSSYDGSLRALDVHSQQCHELFVSKEGGGVSAFDLDTTGTTAIASDPSGSIARVDLRAGKEMDDPIDAHAKKINTVHIEPHAGNYVVTSSTDCTVRVWDARMLSKKATPVSEVDTKKSCQAALFSPSGSSEILTVSYNDRIATWMPQKNNPSEYIDKAHAWHNNQTGRWLLPLRPTWCPDGSGFVIGSMKRQTEVYDRNCKLQSALSSDYQTAVCSRHATHPYLPLIAAGTASGRIHLWRSSNESK